MLVLVGDVVGVERLWAETNEAINDMTELSEGIVDLGRPKIEIFDITDDDCEGSSVGFDEAPESVTIFPVDVVLGPTISGTAILWHGSCSVCIRCECSGLFSCVYTTRGVRQ